ncbi:MAG: macro domain-containing protein [Chloroflexi bacterium]|nr:macro domain-containing protein [Chloroflexota bacterium]
MRDISIGSGRLILVQGDITELERRVGAIVNSAAEDLRAGGGVSAAIHRVGGMELGVECRWIGTAQTGTAVATTSGNLNADAVIHAVGPLWTGGRAGEEKLLASAYRSALDIAENIGLASVAFPSISTGTHGFPFDLATNIAIGTTASFLRRARSVKDVLLVLYTPEEYQVYERALDRFERFHARRAAQEAAQRAS